MSDKISGKFHPIPSTIANQRWISIPNIKIYLETKFRPNRRIFVFWRPFYTLVTMATATILNFFSTPQKLPHTTVEIPTKWIIIWLPNHGYQFPTSKSTRKPNFAQIGGFLYLAAILYLGYHGNGRHFEFVQPPQKLPHTMVDIPTNVHEVWWKESKKNLNPPPFLFPWQLRQSLSNRFRLFWLISFH